MELSEDMIMMNQTVKTKEEAIRLAGQKLVDGGCVTPEYIDSMIHRNEELSTYMGNFIAIPHGVDGSNECIKKTGISIVQIPMGVDFSNSPEEENIVTVVFGIAGLNNEHLDILSKIAIFCSDIHNVVKIADAETPGEIINLFREK